jgi:hypothetical protein
MKKSQQQQKVWENALKIVLKDKYNPCDDCLVKVSCIKSFRNNSACEKLQDALEDAIKELYDED